MACKCVWKRVKGSGDVIVALCAEHELSEKEIRERVRRVDTFEARGTVLVPCGCRPPQRRPLSSSLQASIRDRIAEKRARGEDTTALERLGLLKEN